MRKTKRFLICLLAIFAVSIFICCRNVDHNNATLKNDTKLEQNLNTSNDGNPNISSDSSSTKPSNNSSANTSNSNSNNVSHPLNESKITFKTLIVKDDYVSGYVSNSMDTFSFINEITVSEPSTYIVSLDIYGAQQVTTKTIPLWVGENIVYITEFINDTPINLYKINIYRKHMYTVLFSTKGSSIEKQIIEEGSLATKPNNPTRTGYTFVDWAFDFSTPISENITIQANWLANIDTPYKVEYYLQNLDNDNYTLQTNQTENLKGTTDSIVYAKIKSFEYYTPTKQEVIGIVHSDGSLVLKVYYIRNTYTVTLTNLGDNNGSLVGGDTYRYDKSVTIKATPNLGYVFIGWFDFNTKNLVSSNAVYIFNITKEVFLVAKWQIKEDISIFSFISTHNECTITGLIDKTSKHVIIPDYVTTIQYESFMSNKNLISVTIENAITIIGSHAFAWCSNLKDVIIGNNVTLIDEGAFYGCISLTNIIIPDNVISIGEDAFSNCSALISISIGKGVNNIGNNAFCDCISLTSIIIPDNVTNIGSGVFRDCSNLKIYCKVAHQPYTWNEYWNISNCPVIWGY